MVEEKGELINRIKSFEENELKLKFELDGKNQEVKRLDDALTHSKNELKTFKEYFDTSEQQKNEADEKLRIAQQVGEKFLCSVAYSSSFFFINSLIGISNYYP